MITRPLDLLSRLNRPARDLDVMHWISVIVVMVFFTLVGSRFVIAPGLLIGGNEAEFGLPRLGGGAQYLATAPVVVGFRRDNVILFEGGVYKRLVDLAGPLQAAGRRHRGEILHVMADRQVSVVLVAELSELAIKSGFGGVHMAGRSETLDSEPRPGGK